MVTVRPLAENGKWQYKTEKEYLCFRDGEEMGFTASEFKQAQKEGWEKQYQYKIGRKKEYLTPSTAEELTMSECPRLQRVPGSDGRIPLLPGGTAMNSCCCGAPPGQM